MQPPTKLKKAKIQEERPEEQQKRCKMGSRRCKGHFPTLQLLIPWGFMYPGWVTQPGELSTPDPTPCSTTFIIYLLILLYFHSTLDLPAPQRVDLGESPTGTSQLSERKAEQPQHSHALPSTLCTVRTKAPKVIS